MSNKRDLKGRVLKTGERQRADGRYEFRYQDLNGNTHSVYSWRLVATDKDPAGKRSKGALRDFEKEILKDIGDGINALIAQNTTLNERYEAYIKSRFDLRKATISNYNYCYNAHIKNSIGLKSISAIKYSDLKSFYAGLLEKGLSPKTVTQIHRLIYPVFGIAVKDNLIRNNPASGALSEISRISGNGKTQKQPLTIEQQKAFMDYCRSTRVYAHWEPLFTVMLGTGCRIGEISGLQWSNCDFESRLIIIDKNIEYCMVNGKHRYKVVEPKTEAGKRVIPMFDDVRQALMQEYEAQMRHGGLNPDVVDGVSGFVFKSRKNKVLPTRTINYVMNNIVKGYNAKERKAAKEEGRDPVYLPHISPHILRHTFCTRLCENESNIKLIQEVMGHSKYETTMNIYNKATLDTKREAFKSLEGKVLIR